MSLPMDYGYVISAGIGAIFMVMWKGVRVGQVTIINHNHIFKQDSTSGPQKVWC